MRRQPRVRITRKPRRLACGCTVPAGTPIVTMGKTWLCAEHQPWLKLHTHAEVLAAAARMADDEPRRPLPQGWTTLTDGDRAPDGCTFA
jgi:hypothetical protein